MQGRGRGDKTLRHTERLSKKEKDFNLCLIKVSVLMTSNVWEVHWIQRKG